MRERLQASISLEVALLVSLCSANKDICDDASKCIGMLCKEAKIVDLEEGGEVNMITLACNLKVYDELSAEDSRFIGRKAQQKRIRKYLRLLYQHTPGNMAAWEEAWKRWKYLTLLMSRYTDDFPDDNSIESVSITGSTNGSSTPSTLVASTNSTVLTSSSKKLPTATRIDKNRSTTIIKPQHNLDHYEEKAVEWQNFTGFLAALGGCCLVEIDTIGPLSTPKRVSSASEPLLMVDRFINDMSDMLVSENVYIREGVKDTLGNDLSPALYVILFRHLESYMNKCFDSNGDAIRSPQNKLFVEQSVLVLRLILDRLVDPGDCLLSIDFSTLIHQFADYLNKLPNTYITLRIKIKMCLLIEAVMQKREHIVLRDEMRLRNKLLEISVEWTSDFALVSNTMVKKKQIL